MMRRPFFTGVVAALALVNVPTGARATMPALTEKPDPATVDACQKWAASQNEDALYMWGMQQDGTTSPDIATLRLALWCLGDEPPDIVGFFSSVGAAEAYCREHSKHKICATIDAR
jgi:hypothetical protein